MKKVIKGNYGYISYEKKKRILLTVAAFALPLGLYIIGYGVSESRLNLFSVIAVLGCIPACREAVSMITMLMQKSMPKDRYEEARKAAGNLTAGYEIAITAYEHISLVEAFIVCGDQIVCYTPDKKTDAQYLEKHIHQNLSANGFTEVNVKVMKEFKQYRQRVAAICKNQDHYREGLTFTPDERYPDMSRDEVVYQMVLGLAL